MKRLTINVPATSANLGPGFDTLGLALDVVDTICVELDEEKKEVVLVASSGVGEPLDPHHNLICRAYTAWGEAAGTALPGARFSLESRIPIGKGLGSSAASLVGGLAAAAFATGEKQPHERILQLATEIEGHPDNVAAAVLGGMTTSFRGERAVHALHVANHLALGVALFVPDDTLPTTQARQALPSAVPMTDAVFDLSRVSYLVTALIWGRWEAIGPAMEDRLHQPYRSRLIPALDEVIVAAREAGAYGASLSGGGPSVIALGPLEHAEEIAAAMEVRARELGWAGKKLVTRVRERGVGVQVEEPSAPDREQTGEEAGV